MGRLRMGQFDWPLAYGDLIGRLRMGRLDWSLAYGDLIGRSRANVSLIKAQEIQMCSLAKIGDKLISFLHGTI